MTTRLAATFVLILLLAACQSNPPVPNPTATSLNLQGLPGILPTIAPAEVEAYAQLADESILAAGEALYNQHCAECHGINGEGQFPDAPMQPDETGRLGAPPHTGAGHSWHHDDDLLINYVRDGGVGPPDQFYEMPAFGEVLTDEQIETVIAYIKTFWTEEQRLMQAESTLRIRQQE